jgi:hypothetical protein
MIEKNHAARLRVIVSDRYVGINDLQFIKS